MVVKSNHTRQCSYLRVLNEYYKSMYHGTVTRKRLIANVFNTPHIYTRTTSRMIVERAALCDKARIKHGNETGQATARQLM